MELFELGRLRWPSPLLDDGLVLDAYAGVELGDDGIVVTLASGARLHLDATVPADGVLRLRIGERASRAARRSPMLLDDAAAAPPARVTEHDGGVRLRGPGVDATLTADGGLRCGPYRRPEGVVAMTGTVFASGRLTTADGTPVGWLESLHLAPDAAVYGGGESFQGPDLRGRLRRVVNVEAHGAAGLDVSYLNVPFFWSDAGWGVFAHTGAPVVADLGATHSETAALRIDGDELDLLLFAGDASAIIRRYHDCTGRPGALPEWAFGVWTSRCSYLSEQQIHTVLDEYEAAGCPVDVVHVDWWVEGDLLSEFTCNWSVDRERFPTGWAERLARRGVRVSLWHNPYVLAGSPLAVELAAEGLLVAGPDGEPAITPDRAGRHLVDFTNPAAVAWWQDRVRSTVTAEGVHALKPDFAEELPEDAVLHDGRRGRDARNEYALLYQRATAEALREATGDDAALFCRSGTAGAQRYPCHWVGDTPSTWDGMTTALRACLSLSLSGFGVVASDVGGFFSWRPFGSDNPFTGHGTERVRADVDPALFARWSQWGALTPVMRFHGNGRREPPAYPEPARSVAIRACRLRDALRSYLVDAAAVAVTDGTPMMRPMVLAYPGDQTARAAALQYLLGPDILVAPVLHADGPRRVWAPPGRWEPLWGLQELQGPAWLDVDCPLDAYPVWVRAGSSAAALAGRF